MSATTLDGTPLADLVGLPSAAALNGTGNEHALATYGPDALATLTASAVEALAEQDHVVIQLPLSEECGKQAFEESCSPMIRYKAMRKEMEVSYLGHRHSCKAAFLESLAEEKQEILSALDQCDLLLSGFTKLMLPLASVALEFTPYSRTNGMVRTPFQSVTEQSRLVPYEVDDEDVHEGVVNEHIQFLKRRQLCMLFVVETEGGELTLMPKQTEGEEQRETIKVSTTRGQLIVFRHDRMTYSYTPSSNSDLVLQAWILSQPENLQNLTLDSDNQKFKDELVGLVAGPNTPDGQRIDAIGIAAFFPAGGHSGDQSFWMGCVAGTDGQVKLPLSRFDVDLYYQEPNTWQLGYMYTVHGGVIQDDIYALDNKFFNVSEGEAYLLSPTHRVLLEKGYEALFKSGYNKANLDGAKIGCFCGHSGDDWTGHPSYSSGSEDRHRHGINGRLWSTITGRISFTLGMTGPQSTVDTACSSSLVAYGMGHKMMSKSEEYQTKSSMSNNMIAALNMGSNMIPGPGAYISLCGPHMLSPGGRCFTFDTSADGYERGEGAGAFVTKVQENRTSDTTCTMIGSCLNQDGRSASMTAPNGPAQQACIRGSMREAGLSANQVTCAELHGTGTALGDPIEVGSLRGVMQDRETPLMQTTAKVHLGHLEASAGCAGVIKCLLMCSACAGSPNIHLVSLNPHLDINGYPTVILTELSDFGGNSGYSGVSSFGFGGANARGDVFASANKGPHKLGPIKLEKLDYITVTCPWDEGPMHYLDGKAVPLTNSVKYKRGPYQAEAIRDEFASYDYNSNLYNGQYQLNPPDEDVDEAPSDPIFIVGSWDCFAEPREMEAGDYDGTFSINVALGETRLERFQLLVDKDRQRAIYPVSKTGSTRTRVVGPAPEVGNYWLLDGRDEEEPVGTVYTVTLQWGETPTMRWEKAADQSKPTWMKACTHAYSVVGSFNCWTNSRLQEVSTETSPNTWVATFKVGQTGSESFRFLRDSDPEQAIYPARQNGGEGVPACGPDEFCIDRSWSINGKPGEVVTLQLQVEEAHVTINIDRPSKGKRRVHSKDGPARHSYHLAGSFTGDAYVEMTPDERTKGVFRCRGEVGATGQEYFTIAMDGDPALTYAPETPGAYPGEAIVRSPEEAEDGRVFSVFALRAGAVFEIVFAWNAADRRRVVDINWITERSDFDSLKGAAYDFIASELQ